MGKVENFNAEMIRLEKISKCTVGLSAIHLPTSNSLGYRDNQAFLLCSTYKVPIAAYLLKKVERKELSLEQNCQITEHDLRPGVSSTLTQLNYSTPVALSVFNLLQCMLQESCNTASDILLHLVGGPNAVMVFLREAGITDLRIDRFTLEIIAALDGVELAKENLQFTLDKYKTLEDQISFEEKQAAKEKFKADVKDRGTPKAMSQLLAMIQTGDLLGSVYSELLFKIMRSCKTSAQRIMGFLPLGMYAAHKTGSASGYTNDVGIVYLPDNQGEIALSVYVEHGEVPVNTAERVIAEVARNVIDYFLFQQYHQ